MRLRGVPRILSVRLGRRCVLSSVQQVESTVAYREVGAIFAHTSLLELPALPVVLAVSGISAEQVVIALRTDTVVVDTALVVIGARLDRVLPESPSQATLHVGRVFSSGNNWV